MAERRQIIIGNQSNDGTGDSIRDAFDKVNKNFIDLYDAAGFGNGFSFLKLKEGPSSLVASNSASGQVTVIGVNEYGTKLLNKTMIAGTGMQLVLYDDQIIINSTASTLRSETRPILGGDLDAQNAYNLINIDPNAPIHDYDAVSKRWVYENFVNRDGQTVFDVGANRTATTYEGGSTIRDNVNVLCTATSSTHVVNKGYADGKLSLAGISAYDHETGAINPTMGTMTGALLLFRDPILSDHPNTAATKHYVENNSFVSKVNFFVSLDGEDNRLDIPAHKKGRAWAYAFKTINRAALAAEQYLAASQITLGPYKKTISINNNQELAEITAIDSVPAGVLDTIQESSRLTIDIPTSAGSDPYQNGSIIPGLYLVGERSGATAVIENITIDSVNNKELYDVVLEDYGLTFTTDITPSSTDDIVTFTFVTPNLINIPDFWIGSKFTKTDSSGNVLAAGVITEIGYTEDINGNVYDTFTVDFRDGTPLTNGLQITYNRWHIHTADFQVGERLIWGQKQQSDQITINVESGEHEDQYPIKVSNNVSIKGDEFRRSVVRPAKVNNSELSSISSSKWANTKFYRDTQIDGIIVVQLDETYDYVDNLGAFANVTPDSTTNDPQTEVIVFTVTDASSGAGIAVPDTWVGKVFKQVDGQYINRGVIMEVSGNTFSVNIAENNYYNREITTLAGVTISSGNWFVYAPINYGYHYLRDASKPVEVFITETNPGSMVLATHLLKENKRFIQAEVTEYLSAKYESYSYDEAKCSRDTGLIIDAIAQDLLFGGTSQATFSGVQYWNHGSYVGAITEELTTTTNAITYIKSLAGKVVINDVTGSRYQTTVPQVVNLYPATASEQTAVRSKFDVILGILSSGIAGITDTIVPNGLTVSSSSDVRNAHAILRANKEYLKAEAIAYVEATKAEGFVYDEGKCIRDVDYMIDAVSIDLLYGGNRQSVQSGVYYYGYSSTSSAIPNERNQATSAYNYLRNTILPTYITDPEILASAQSKIDIIVDIIAGGPSVANAPSPLGVTMTENVDIIAAATAITNNKSSIEAAVIAYINSTFGAESYTFDHDKCFRDVGTLVDGIIGDMMYGTWSRTINNADQNSRITSLTTGECADAIEYINTIGQDIIANIPVAPYQEVEVQVIDEQYVAESSASAVLADLIQAAVKVLNLDADFNPPKYNDQMDVFLMNDSTMIRYLSCQGHGGFMKVLDPDGQILAKSPYTQTASSFSKSYNRHVFSGGMFVDGFAGNITMTPSSSYTTAQPDVDGNLTKIYVEGIGRPSVNNDGTFTRPQTPTFFVHAGITYEVDFISGFNNISNTGVLNLNAEKPGGVESVSSISGSGFKASSTIPVTFSAPTGTGGLTAKGTATTNGAGSITGITITFAGTGYESAPTFTVGGAAFNFTYSTSGAISGYTIIKAGSGYKVGTQINFSTPAGGVPAVATVTTVNSSGGITAIGFSNNGSGYSTSSKPVLTFGTGVGGTPIIKKGFIGTLPDSITLVTAGNRSMLANDFTQLNDLGYGIFATNGGFIENVSMFTYYCWTSYYALGGSQIRTITGSSAYGIYGLVSEGSDPNEVPIEITNQYDTSQIGISYNQGGYINVTGGSTIYLQVTNYEPLPQSKLDINHYGIRKTYNIRSATLVTDAGVNNLYSLAVDDGAGGGLYAQVPDGQGVTIRVDLEQLISGLNPAVITRPSTVLTLDEDPYQVYRILSYTDAGNDSAIAEADTGYDYIVINPYKNNDGSYRQGLNNLSWASKTTVDGTPVGIINSGTQYSLSGTYSVTFPAPAAKTAQANGAQGTLTSPVDLITIQSASGIIHPGMTLSSSGSAEIPTGTYVLWANSYSSGVTKVRLSQSIYNLANGETLTFTGRQAYGTAHISDLHTVDYVTLIEHGVGYETTTIAGTIAPSGGGGVQATVTASVAGLPGKNSIKIIPLSSAEVARITSGLTASTPYYYYFGFEGLIFKITGYNDTSITGGDFAELQFVLIDDGTSGLEEQMLGDVLYGGIGAGQPGNVTSKISTLRATSHDMVDVGTGGYASAKIPNDLYGPPLLDTTQANEVRELSKGRVYFVTTDQDGNFRVGKFFSVDQGRGTVSISAPISLTNVDGISFKRGDAFVNRFSTDGTMAAEATSKVPVEQAIVTYVNKRLGVDKNSNQYTGGLIGPGFLDLLGVQAMKSDINMDNNRITNLEAPSITTTDAANKAYVDQRIHRLGTNSVDQDNTTPKPDWGKMAGPLWAHADPVAGDPALQVATKRYTDKRTQLGTLNDVDLAAPKNLDLLMFTNEVLSVNTSSTRPIWTATNRAVNVSLTNSSHVSFYREWNNILRVSINNNTITNVLVKSDADIAQSKLNMTTGTTYDAATVGTRQEIQATLGLASFCSADFTATNGWISLKDQGVTYNNLVNISGPAGGVLGNTTAGNVSELSSSTVKTWLQYITKDGSVRMEGSLLPASTSTITLGSNTYYWAFVYANRFMGTATNALYLKSSTGAQTFIQSSTGSTGATIVERDAGGDIYATNYHGSLFGGNAGNIVYQSAANATTFLDNGLTSQLLTSQGSGLAPTWTSQSDITAGKVGHSLSTGTTSYLVGSSFDGSADVSWKVDASSSNLNGKVVARDANGDFSARTVYAALSGNATSADQVNNELTPGWYVSGSTYNGGAARTWNINGTWTNNASSLVARDISGNFRAGIITATTFVGNIQGNITGTADKVGHSLTRGSYLTGNDFDGSAGTTWAVDATSSNTVNKVVVRDASGDFSAGTITATFSGDLSGNVTGNLTGTPTVPSIVKSGTNGTGDIGQTGNRFGTIYGTASSASYADLAEKYVADANYEPGTVLVFGGNAEVTAATQLMDRRIAGVVSTNPAYLMNDCLENGVAVALTGRVPCKVVGTIKKGDMLVSSGIRGVATASDDPTLGSVIGKALEDYDGQSIGLIEVVVGRL